MRSPCKDCPDRWAECHAVCERWAEWEKAKTEEYKRRREAGETNYFVRHLECERNRKMKRGKLKARRTKESGTS